MEELMKKTPKEKEEESKKPNNINKGELVVRRVVDPDTLPSKPLHPGLPQTGGPGGGALVLMCSPVKTGKCLDEYTIVDTTAGKKYIKDLNIGDFVNSVNGMIEVNNIFMNGKKECNLLTLHNGLSLTATLNHKIETNEGMIRIGDLTYKHIIYTEEGITNMKKVEYVGERRTWDIQVNHEDHTFYANNISTSNSTLISNMLLNPDFYGQDYFDYVKVMSNTIYNDVTSRFLLKAFDVTDHYDENELAALIENQKKYEKDEQPEICYCCDDLLGSVPRNSLLNHLCARFRHYNFKLFIISSQNFKAVSTITRQNATNVIVGSPYPNIAELKKIAESYGDLFGGEKKWLQLYKLATPNKYDFLHMNLQENPPTAHSGFSTTPLAVGDKIINASLPNLSDEEDDEIFS